MFEFHCMQNIKYEDKKYQTKWHLQKKNAFLRTNFTFSIIYNQLVSVILFVNIYSIKSVPIKFKVPWHINIWICSTDVWQLESVQDFLFLF